MDGASPAPTLLTHKDSRFDTLSIIKPSRPAAEQQDVRHRGTCKHRTRFIGRSDVEAMVTEFSCYDGSNLTSLGKHCKEMRWKVQIGLDADATPLDIRVTVDKSIALNPKVVVTCDGQEMRPIAGLHTAPTLVGPPKLKEDIRHEWRFRGMIQSLHEPDAYEVRPHCGIDSWHRATITGQREAGYFEAMVLMEDRYGYPEYFSFPAVEKEDIRVASTKMPLQIPECLLELEVPKVDPSTSTLLINGNNVIGGYLGRQSPAPNDKSVGRKIVLQTTPRRDRVKCNVGHFTLCHFLSTSAQLVSCDASRLMHTWTLQLGPFAKHSIKVEKKYHLGMYIQLCVDGSELVQACAGDLGCNGEWRCKFRFVGERAIDFDINETDADGNALNSRAVVTRQFKYSHECELVVSNSMDLSSAELIVDGLNFRALPQRAPPRNEDHIHMSLQAFQQTYGIHVPFKVRDDCDSSLPRESSENSSRRNGPPSVQSFLSNLFGGRQGGLFCCSMQTGTVVEDSVEERLKSEGEVYLL